MPRDHIYAICEKVIIDQNQTPSLISIFDKVSVTVPPNAPDLPANAVMPRDWTVYSSWFSDKEDDGKTVSVCTQILFPDKTQFGEIYKFPLKMEFGKRAQAITRMNGLPIGQTGFYSIRTWLESDGKTIGKVRDIPVELEIVKQPEPNTTQAASSVPTPTA
jgi:hypothetical protein